MDLLPGFAQDGDAVTAGLSGWELLLPVLVLVMFVAVVGLIVFAVTRAIVKSIRQRRLPVCTVRAMVVAKRAGTLGGENSATRYFTTFELPSGERLELRLNGKQYGLVVERDVGMLTYQGEVYRDFARQLPETPM